MSLLPPRNNSPCIQKFHTSSCLSLIIKQFNKYVINEKTYAILRCDPSRKSYLPQLIDSLDIDLDNLCFANSGINELITRWLVRNKHVYEGEEGQHVSRQASQTVNYQPIGVHFVEEYDV